MSNWWLQSQRKRKRAEQIDRTVGASSSSASSFGGRSGAAKSSKRIRRYYGAGAGYTGMGPIKGRELRAYYSDPRRKKGRRGGAARRRSEEEEAVESLLISPAAEDSSRAPPASAAGSAADHRVGVGAVVVADVDPPEERNDEVNTERKPTGAARGARARVRIDGITLDAMRTEYLALRDPVTEHDYANYLLRSESVFFQHAHPAADGADCDDDDAIDSDRVFLVSDSEDDARIRAHRREAELRGALRSVANKAGSYQRTIENWDAAMSVLSAVMDFPSKGSKRGGDGVGRAPGARGGSRRTVKLRPARKHDRFGFQKYRDMLQNKLRSLQHRRASFLKWKQISHWSVPEGNDGGPGPEVEAVEAGVQEEHRDEAASGAVPSGDESDRLLDERIAEAERTARARIRSADEAVEAAVAEREDREAREEEARSLASSLLRPLTPEEEAIVQNAIYGLGPEEELLAKSDSGDSVQRHSMWKLKPGTWLNDEVIHYFLLMLSRRDAAMCQDDPSRKRSHFFKSFFVTKLLDEGGYNYKNVRRWSKKVPGKDIFNLSKIIFPVNVGGMHWTCIVAFMEEKRIQYYDSMGSGGREFLEGIFKYLKDEHKAKKGGPLPDEDEWQLVGCTPDTPQQLNGFDCGVFTCMFADFLSKDCPLTFSQEHINQCRERIALSIMNGSAIH